MKIPLLLALSALIAGCGSSVDNTPPPSAMTPHASSPAKVPTTIDEKIQAIQNAPLSADQKKAEIEKVKSGKL